MNNIRPTIPVAASLNETTQGIYFRKAISPVSHLSPWGPLVQ